jgi:predicted  nucleic acid-binding Zn-ribbon protein
MRLTECYNLPNNREKFPELWAQKEALEKRKAEIRAESDPIRARKDALQRKIQVLQEEVDGLVKEIKAIESPDLFVIDQEISVIARLMSGYRLSAEAM